MDPKHSGNVLKHLEMQKKLLMDAYKSMSHEVHSLQVEEEMLMRKYYEFMTAQGLVDKKTSGDVEVDEGTSEAGASDVASRDERS